MVCGDRPIGDAYDTLTTIGFSKKDVDIIPAFGAHSKPTYVIIDEIIKRGVRLIFWEGFDMLVKSPNNPHEVKEMLSSLTAYCEGGITIIGTVGVAKLKPHEMYQNPRQLVAGSSIWERATSSNLIIAAVNPKNIEDPRRVLYASLKNAPSFAVEGQFDESGILNFDDWTDRIQSGALIETRKRRNGHGA
jgi:hypothetical protein